LIFFQYVQKIFLGVDKNEKGIVDLRYLLLLCLNLVINTTTDPARN
jgi:hypothetical protein